MRRGWSAHCGGIGMLRKERLPRTNLPTLREHICTGRCQEALPVQVSPRPHVPRSGTATKWRLSLQIKALRRFYEGSTNAHAMIRWLLLPHNDAVLGEVWRLRGSARRHLDPLTHGFMCDSWPYRLLCIFLLGSSMWWHGVHNTTCIGFIHVLGLQALAWRREPILPLRGRLSRTHIHCKTACYYHFSKGFSIRTAGPDRLLRESYILHHPGKHPNPDRSM